ncbi:MAG TPA: phosphoribosylglycinamide formyltransferase [Candidatus Saccharimonadaceae bacterium]|nr:phosphoribosylglycinamide formyltransferase [Candidatus Saccharimonadaceae bacterium]
MTFTTRMLAVLASGNGSNFEALALAARRGELGGRIAVLLSDRADAPALARAARLGIASDVLPVGRYRTRIEDEAPWVECLRAHGVECVLMAGFMRRIHHTLLDAFPSRILNIHPSLLPAFPGRDAITDALHYGVSVTGCTVHVVGAGLDDGPIVAQRAVEVREGDTRDTLAERIHAAEHALYPMAVRRFLEEPWTRDGRRLVFQGSGEPSHG